MPIATLIWPFSSRLIPTQSPYLNWPANWPISPIDLLDFRAGLLEAAMLNEKIYLDQMRQGLILDVQKRGAVHGR